MYFPIGSLNFPVGQDILSMSGEVMNVEIDYKAIGKRIKLARIKAEVTQERLAELLGVDPSYISRLENGTKNINLIRLMEIADILTPSSLDTLVYDSLREHTQEYDAEATDLLNDCDSYERRLLVNQLRDYKEKMRALKEHYSK